MEKLEKIEKNQIAFVTTGMFVRIQKDHQRTVARF